MAADILIIPEDSTIQFTSSTGNYNAVIQKSDGTLNFTGNTSYSGDATFFDTVFINNAGEDNTADKFFVYTTGGTKVRKYTTVINRALKEVTGTTYTFVKGDEEKWIRTTASTTTTLQFDGSTFTDGDTLIITQYGAGQVRITGDYIGAPVVTTLLLPNRTNGRTRSQYSTIFLKFVATTSSLILGGDLESTAGPSGGVVNTSQTTTSTSYTDLTTLGPQASVVIGPSGNAIVSVTAEAMTNSNGVECYMGFAISGATTVAANDDQALTSATRNTGDLPKSSGTFWVSGLNQGSHTFTAKYRTTSGTATFADRNITVIPV